MLYLTGGDINSSPVNKNGFLAYWTANSDNKAPDPLEWGIKNGKISPFNTPKEMLLNIMIAGESTMHSTFEIPPSLTH
jgi:hypothetical protein